MSENSGEGRDGSSTLDENEVKKALASSSPAIRIAHLQLIETAIADNVSDSALISRIFQLLFHTHARYQDRESRLAVQKCLLALLSKEGGDTEIGNFVEMMGKEGEKQSSAKSSAFVLVEWCSLLIQTISGTAQWAKLGEKLILADADALEKCLQPPSKHSVVRSALTVTRRAVRKLLNSSSSVEANLGQIVGVLTLKRANSMAKHSILLGIVAGVCNRLPHAKPLMESHKQSYYEFFTREVISARNYVPKHISGAMNDFFSSFATIEDVRSLLLPSVEKALLRSPEIVLDGVLTQVISSLPTNLDLSQILEQNLLKPTLSNIKSSNAIVRNGALSAFQVVSSRCNNSEIIDRIVQDLLATLKGGKIASPDHRIIYAEMLQASKFSVSAAQSVSVGLCTTAVKEGNEGAMAAVISALAHAVVLALSGQTELDNSVTDTFVKGLEDKKLPMRKLWFLGAGKALGGLCASSEDMTNATSTFTEVIALKTLDSFLDITSNTATSSQTSLMVGGYIAITLGATIEHRLANRGSAGKIQAASKAIVAQALQGNIQQSFLLNPRVYGKFLLEEDMMWFCEALYTASEYLTIDVDEEIRVGWAEAVIFMITTMSLPSRIRRNMTNMLSKIYSKKPVLISTMILEGLWSTINSSLETDKEAESDRTRLIKVLRAICLDTKELQELGGQVSQEQLKAQLCRMIVLSRSELIPRANWIDICLSVGVDPGSLATTHSEILLREVGQRTASDELPLIKTAAYRAAADLAFVAPDTIVPLLLARIKDDLNSKLLEAIGPVEAAISKSPGNICFIDILAKKTQASLPTKFSEDFDFAAWESTMRADLSLRQKTPKKLNAEESAKVKAQLQKENSIRSSVYETQAKFQRGFGIIEALATGPPTEPTLWLGTAVQLLLSAIDTGASHITGNAASTTFMLCSERVSSRLGVMRPSIGAAILRLRNVAVASNYEEEPLDDLLTRALYRLRFAGEQRPFDVATLMYTLPLVVDILRKGGVGDEADERDAQLVLAIEILSFHTNVCQDESLPRTELLSVLVESMQSYSQHYKLVKDCFADMCRCIAPNITTQEMKVLAEAAIVPQASVRTTVLQSISSDIDMSEIQCSDEIWLAYHDDVEDNQLLGQEIWEESGFSIDADAPMRLAKFLHNKDGQLRRAAARALADALQTQKTGLQTVLNYLMASYLTLSAPKQPQLDEYGLPRKIDLSDPWEARHGIATAFKELAQGLNKEELDSLFSFWIDSGPFADKDARVRAEMLDAALRAIELHGKQVVDELMLKFESTLQNGSKNTDAADRLNEAVIIVYGALARHLAAGDAKIPIVIDRLLATLNTPSETVQYAISECLPPLIRAVNSERQKYFQRVLDELLESKDYASQRGAAYGLAGMVQGIGVGALRQYRIMSVLKSSMEDKKDARKREAALMGFELLSLILGRLFEPYVLQIVPQLLSGFGDASADVRDACLAAAKSCFGKLSSYGVKQIMPTLLGGLDDQQWRSKRGACDLLGAMAYLDPYQLATSLPDIIPPLTGVLNDSHKEVRAAANRSLKRFGEVITNPEIKGLVDMLLKALSDPTKYTDDALDALIKVQFVHYLDAPSLALVTRILQRGLGDRSNTKRKAAQVIGSLAHLTEKKDIIIHLPLLVAGLKVAAVDPVPTTRATASRALGSLVEKLGEDALPDLIPGLMQTLKSDTGAGDRLGSAQALSEVLAGLGTARLEETLPTILQNVDSAKPAVREGFMSLFIFLPVCFGNSFANYLGRIVPPILAGLADDVESIRETALRAGRLLVKNFAVRAVDLLLPELERGLADDSYRIRLSSVELVGDLLFNLTGIKASIDPDEEPDEADEAMREAGASLKEALGEEKRNKILSALYICRCDTAGAVRSAAISVWKVLVHSPRTLKELVPTLTQLLIRRLGSANMEHKVIASNALGELIRKAGDGVLASLLPTLEEGLLTSTDSDAKQGICLALRELIASATPESLEDHEKTLISVVRTALTDSDEDVREAAAEAFDSLQNILGKRAVDQVLPFFLNLLRSESDAQNALAALLTLLTETTRSNIILPSLIPTLTTPPITAFDAKALASLSRVAGAAMNRRLPAIINSLMDNEVNCSDEDLREELESSFDTVIQSIDEYDGLNTVMNVLLGLLKHEDHRVRAATANHFGNFFTTATVDYSRYNQNIIRTLLNSFDDSDDAVVKAAWAALTDFTKKLKKEEMESLVPSTRQTLLRVGVAGSNLRGFELPKGINAILPIFLQGLMNGTADQRMHAALGISDIVDRASEASLKPFVTQITGPLIRVVSERSTDVKSAILLTLNNLLDKMPLALKPFLPQLQRTFAKSLADPSSDVLRTRAAKALGTLIKYTPRIDPLITELVAGSKTTDSGVKTAMLKALYEVISRAGANMGETSRSAVLSLIDLESDERDDGMMVTNAKLFGALIKNVPDEIAVTLLKNRVFAPEQTISSALALNAVLSESADVLINSGISDELPDLLCKGMINKNVYVADSYIVATGKLLLSSPPRNFDAVKKIFDMLGRIIEPGNPVDSRRLALVVIRTLSRKNMELVRPHVPILAPAIFSSVRDLIIPVKLAAEAAFVELFSVVDEEGKFFDKFMAGPGADLPPNVKRSMPDYFKRVTLRLGNQARERREAEGGQGSLGLSNDEEDDEREIWTVGRMETGGESFV